MERYKGTGYFTGSDVSGGILIEIGERTFIQDEAGDWIQVNDDETLIKVEEDTAGCLRESTSVM